LELNPELFVSRLRRHLIRSTSRFGDEFAVLAVLRWGSLQNPNLSRPSLSCGAGLARPLAELRLGSPRRARWRSEFLPRSR
jgi:hypothetical protein